jgi:hypothetical protein
MRRSVEARTRYMIYTRGQWLLTVRLNVRLARFV